MRYVENKTKIQIWNLFMSHVHSRAEGSFTECVYYSCVLIATYPIRSGVEFSAWNLPCHKRHHIGAQEFSNFEVFFISDVWVWDACIHFLITHSQTQWRTGFTSWIQCWGYEVTYLQDQCWNKLFASQFSFFNLTHVCYETVASSSNITLINRKTILWSEMMLFVLSSGV